MAICFFNISSVSRGAGQCATSAAAYRSGTRIRDLQTGIVFNHSRRRDVEHAEILLPARPAGLEPSWARDRSHLWNAAEAAERRGNARIAREYLMTLPHELTAAQRLDLARAYAQGLALRYGVAVDLAVHQPREGGDPRNHHAHVLMSTRVVLAQGFGAKSDLELADWVRRERGLQSARETARAARKEWADQANLALERAGSEVRLDPRSLVEQGIDRVPTTHLGPAVTALIRRGRYSYVYERILAEREAERLRTAALREASLAGGAETAVGAGGHGGVTRGMSPVAARQAAAERWLALRSQAQQGKAQWAQERERERTADHDWGLEL